MSIETGTNDRVEWIAIARPCRLGDLKRFLHERDRRRRQDGPQKIQRLAERLQKLDGT